MAMKAFLQGNAGTYQIRGAIWELGSSAYRAYVHLVPILPHSSPSRSVVCVEGTTMQEVLDATHVHVKSTVGRPAESLEAMAPTPEPDTVRTSAAHASH